MIIFDLDSTLADCEHRRHFLEDRREINSLNVFHVISEKFKPDWKSFYEACDKDLPILPAILTMRRLSKFDNIHIWSGRDESVREKTEKWLRDNFITYSELKMRPEGNTEPQEALKEQWLDELIIKRVSQKLLTGKDFNLTEECKPIQFVFDSDIESIKMWRRRGIFVFNCCQYDEEF